MTTEGMKAHVLLVDDEELVRVTLQRMLSAAGYQVSTADSAEQALEMAATQGFDVLVTDVYMPGVPGDQLVTEIQRLQPDMLPVVITAYPDMDLAIRAVNRGARRFLVKPVSVDALETTLAEILEQRQQEILRVRWDFAEQLLVRQEEAGDAFDFEAAITALVEDGIAPEAEAMARRNARVIVLCEELDADVKQLRTAEPYRHFRTIYRAQKVLNGQLQRAGVPASVRLAVVSRAADLPRCLEEHGERVHTVILGPTFHRQAAALIRLLAAARGQHTVVCHESATADFPWVQFAKLGGDLSVRGYRSTATEEETAAFWADYFAREVRADLDAPAAPSPEGNGGTLTAAREAIERDPVTAGLMPSFPEVCQRAIDAIDSGASFDAVGAIVALDGPLLATLVHRANAAAYGAQRVESAETALSVIGTAEAKKLLLSRAMGQIVRRVQQAGFSNRDFFLHSATVGFLAQLLSHNPGRDGSGRDDTDAARALPAGLPTFVVDLLHTFRLWETLPWPAGRDAFAAGVLHDIGKVALAACYPDAYPLIVHEIQRRLWHGGSCDAEAAATGNLTHGPVGGALLESWDIFPDHRDSTTHHHHIDAKSPTPTALIALANCLAQGMHPFPAQARVPQPQREEFLGIADWDDFEQQANPLLDGFQRLCADFDGRRRALAITTDERETGRYRRATLARLAETARQTVLDDGRQYLGALLHQSPELLGAAARADAEPAELLALGLLLHQPTADFVAELFGLTTAVDPIVRRALAA